MPVWSTPTVKAVQDGTIPMELLVESPFFKGTRARKAGLDYSYSQEELDFKTTMDTMPPDNTEIATIFMFPPRAFQEVPLYKLFNYRFNLIHAPRQAGVSTMLMMTAIVKAMTGKKVLVIQPNGAMCESFVERTKEMLITVPFYLQPGVSAWNVRSLNFENGSTITAKDGKSLSKTPDLDSFLKEYDHIIVDGSDYINEFYLLYPKLIVACSEASGKCLTFATTAGDKWGLLHGLSATAAEKGAGQSSWQYTKMEAEAVFSSDELARIEKALGQGFEKEYSVTWQPVSVVAENSITSMYKQAPEDMVKAPSPFKAMVDAGGAPEDIVSIIERLQWETRDILEASGSVPTSVVVRMLEIMRLIVSNKREPGQ